MAKSKKDKAKKALSKGGNLYSQEAISQVFSHFSKLPDNDEVLRKAGVARHRLKVLLDDDEIGQAAETRQDALLAMPYTLEPSDTTQTKFLKQELEEWFSEIVGAAHNALFNGYSVQEAVYEIKEDGYIGLQWIGEKPMQWFEPKNDGRLIYRQDSSGMAREVDQHFKFFLTRRKATYEQPYGKPLLGSLYWLHFFKQNGFKFWAKFLERFGTPILLGKCNRTETSDMIHALLNAHAQSVLAIDTEDDVQILGSNSANAGTTFEVFDQTIKRQIQKMILGQTLTSGTDGVGSRALGEVHENVRQDKLKSDIRLVTPTIQAIINALCDLNGWPPHKIILGEVKQINKHIADRDAVLKNAGVQFSKRYFIKSYGFDDEDLVETTALPQTTFSAIPNQAFQFAAKSSPQQQEIDDLANQPMQLLSDAQIESIVASSSSIEEVQDKIFSALQDIEKTLFHQALDKAFFVADLKGFEHSQGDR